MKSSLIVKNCRVYTLNGWIKHLQHVSEVGLYIQQMGLGRMNYTYNLAFIQDDHMPHMTLLNHYFTNWAHI